ncbi:hypothetical protein KP509_06G021400 [Ceratopteris richardii]|uniref:Terpene synthase n=1 Tax=Ceratopteris richardii TaxID=49495 RepID=A0A8T2UQN0_CERRI|nr:hypothetical protein KP509_06G021400 [Ceratopteris richardii]
MFASKKLPAKACANVKKFRYLLNGFMHRNTMFPTPSTLHKSEAINSTSGCIVGRPSKTAYPEQTNMVEAQRHDQYNTSTDGRGFTVTVAEAVVRNLNTGFLRGLQQGSWKACWREDDSSTFAPAPGPAQKERKRLIPISDLKDVKMPELTCSFASELNPYYEAVREECEEWISVVATPTTPQAHKFLLDCQLPRLVCRCLPNVPEHAVPRLLQTMKMISWLLIADSEDDDPSEMGSDYMATSSRSHSIMAILYGNDSIPTPCSGTYNAERLGGLKAREQFLNGFRELCGEILPSMSPKLRARFVSSMASYLDSLKIQAAFRRVNHIPDVHFYMDIRRQASFMYPAFVLGEYVLGLELEEVVHSDRFVLDIQDIAVDFVNLCNDVVSCRQEASEGDYFNLPSILYINQPNSCLKLTFQEALDITAHITRDLDNRCALLQRRLDDTYTSHSTAMHTFMKVLLNSMSGCLTWFLESARYKVAPLPQRNVMP